MQTILGKILGETEVDCSAHVEAVSVTYDRRPVNVRSAGIIAALLRVLAERTDGFCAVRGADDADLTDTGMLFWFTSDEKRDAFLSLIERYLSDGVQKLITPAKI